MAEEPEATPSTVETTPPVSEKSSNVTSKINPQVPIFPSFPGFAGGDMQMFPIMYPALTPNAIAHDQEQMNRGAGLYAVPIGPYMRPITGVPPTALIPLTYTIPTRLAHEAGASNEENGQVGQQQPAHERQVVVRRFQIAIQLDLLLILKLAAAIYFFSHDGSRLRLAVLVFFASLVYLYQTGALSPLIQWLSQGMQRPAQPPHRARPAAAVAGNGPPAAGQVNEDRALAGEGRNDGGENENRAENNEDRAVGNENAEEAAANNGANNNNNHWLGIMKEIQMFVFGFITSLLPGFHNID